MPRGIDIKSDTYIPAAKHNTICEVHRKIYFILSHEFYLHNHREELKKLIEEAFSMAKKMSNKLLQYNRNLGSDWYQVHKNDGGDIDEA